MSKERDQIRKALDIILENTLSRIYISRLNQDDRFAIYSEFKEWIEAKDILQIKGNIIYCNYINQNRY